MGKLCHRPGALTGRLSSRHSETGQTNRLSIEPMRQRTQHPFLKPRSISQPFHSAPVSETDVQCVHQNHHRVPFETHYGGIHQFILIRSAELEFLRLSGIESLSFLLDTIPLLKNKAARRATSAQQLALRPAKHSGVYRATAAQCPSSCRETSHATPMNVRAMVGATARKCLGNCR